MNQRIIASIFVIAVCTVISAQAAIASISETGNQREARQYYPAQVDHFGNPVGVPMGGPVMYQQPMQPQTIVVESQQASNPAHSYSGGGGLGAIYGALLG